MTVVEAAEMIQKRVVKEWPSPSTNTADQPVPSRPVRVHERTHMLQSAPLTRAKVPAAMAPNLHTAPPNHPCRLASTDQMVGM